MSGLKNEHMIKHLTKIKCAPATVAILTLLLSHPAPASAQQTAVTIPGPGQRGPGLTKFDLDFPGGNPKDLVAAIQKSMSRPLNVIIPEEFETTRLPALKMKNVDAPQLFRALEAASSKPESFAPGFYAPGMQPSARTISYGFRANDNFASDDTIWYFYVQKPNPMALAPKDCRFYSLASYLDGGLTVDDITTAIKTGAKMLGENQEPTISFHKDTKLLIAVGEPSKLEIIDSVLKALDSQRPVAVVPGFPGQLPFGPDKK